MMEEFKEGSVHSAVTDSGFSGEINQSADHSSSFHFEKPLPPALPHGQPRLEKEPQLMRDFSIHSWVTDSDFSGEINQSAYHSSSFYFEKNLPPPLPHGYPHVLEEVGSTSGEIINQSADPSSDPAYPFRYGMPLPPALPHEQPREQPPPQQPRQQPPPQQQQKPASPQQRKQPSPQQLRQKQPSPQQLRQKQPSPQQLRQKLASPQPGTYVVQLPKDKVFRVPPPPSPQQQQQQQKPASPLPGTYLVQVPKDTVFRVPTPENERLFQDYTRRAERRNGSACRYVLVAILCLAVLSAVAVGVGYRVYKPRKPAYTVVSLAVSGMGNASAPGAFSPGFDATVRADNTANRKVGVHYDVAGSRVAVSYQGVSLAQGAWPAFYQAPGNVTVFIAKATGTGIRFSEHVRRQIAAAERRRSVPLDVEIKVRGRLQLGGLKMWAVPVTVRCAMAVDSLDDKAKVVSRSCDVNK